MKTKPIYYSLGIALLALTAKAQDAAEKQNMGVAGRRENKVTALLVLVLVTPPRFIRDAISRRNASTGRLRDLPLHRSFLEPTRELSYF
jgi:hypothetical protein